MQYIASPLKCISITFRIFPVSFGERHRQMLGNVKKWIDKGQVAIDSELLTELRTATSDEEMTLDKTEYSMDLLDSLRLAFEYIVY
jgi:hypothetical protein